MFYFKWKRESTRLTCCKNSEILTGKDRVQREHWFRKAAQKDSENAAGGASTECGESQCKARSAEQFLHCDRVADRRNNGPDKIKIARFFGQFKRLQCCGAGATRSRNFWLEPEVEFTNLFLTKDSR